MSAILSVPTTCTRHVCQSVRVELSSEHEVTDVNYKTNVSVLFVPPLCINMENSGKQRGQIKETAREHQRAEGP